MGDVGFVGLAGLLGGEEVNDSGPGILPILKGIQNAPPPVACRLSTGSAHSSFVAATSSVTESTPATLAASANPNPLSLTPIQRLAYYDPTSRQFVPVTRDDPRLVGKDVTVMVHWLDRRLGHHGQRLHPGTEHQPPESILHARLGGAAKVLDLTDQASQGNLHPR